MLFSLLAVFAVSVVISALLTRNIRNLALAKGWLDKPDIGRHIHRTPVPRLGGIAIFTTVIAMTGVGLWIRETMGLRSLLSSRSTLAILGPATMIFLMGLYDDMKDLRARTKFGIEILAGLWLYLEGFGIRRFGLVFGQNDLKVILGIPLTILWVLLITNAFNLIDGLDGLSAGSALFSTLTLLVVSLFGRNLSVGLITVALAGAIVGFLRFNFHPATIFLGDSGSLFIGFLLSALALAGSQKAPTMVSVVVPVVCFGFPILDVTLAVARRFLSGRPLFEPDSDHIHHRLLKRGLSQRGVVFVLYGVSGLLALLSLASLRGGEMTAVVMVVIAIGICIGIPQLRFHELQELRRVVERTMSQKRIIANDLHVRRAVESLRSCKDMSEICGVLVGTLQPIGFDGFSLSLPATEHLHTPLPPLVKRNPNGDLTCSWTTIVPVKGNWELRWELMDERGSTCGSFSVFKRLTDKPLLMDVSLLGDSFHAALADAVQRAAIDNHLNAGRWKQGPFQDRFAAVSASSLSQSSAREATVPATPERIRKSKNRILNAVERKSEV